MRLFIFVLGSLPLLAKEADWNAPNILMDGNPPKWYQLDMSHYEKGPQPFKPHDDKWARNETTIVVLIAALRETRLADTLHTMLSTAAHPGRVHFAVVQQNAESDVDCVAGMCEKFGTPVSKDASGNFVKGNCKFFEHVRVIRMKDTDAKGPVFARAKQSQLVTEEDDYCMQIDAHTHTVPDWDVLMLQQWGAANNEYAVLTSYPTNVHDLGKNSNNHWEMPHLCTASFVGEGKVSNGQASAAANLQRPILTPLWAAGLSFSRCHAERNVPNDENLLGIFSGEEYGRGARLFTHGYDFYSITRPLIGTFYGGEKGNHGSWHSSKQEEVLSSHRLATLLKWPNSDQTDAAVAKLGKVKYALGSRRTLETYAQYSGVDTIHQKLNKKCRCEFQPWEESEKSTAYSEYHGSDQIAARLPPTSKQQKAAALKSRLRTVQEQTQRQMKDLEAAKGASHADVYAEAFAHQGAAAGMARAASAAAAKMAHLQQLSLKLLEKNEHTHKMVEEAEKAAGVMEEELEMIEKKGLAMARKAEAAAETDIKQLGASAGVELGTSSIKMILGFCLVVAILLCVAVFMKGEKRRKRFHPKYSM